MIKIEKASHGYAHGQHESWSSITTVPVQRSSSGSVSDASALSRVQRFIAENGYRPGDRLPSERVMIGELGLRRTELRRALQSLERDAVLWRHVGKGTFLADQSDQCAQSGLAQPCQSLLKRMSPADVMMARATLEPAIARLAATHACAVDIAALRQLAERSRQASAWSDYQALDNELHRQIAAAAGSLALLALFDQLNALRHMVAWGRLKRNSAGPPANHPSFVEHDRLIDAIAACDSDLAEQVMHEHLRSVGNRFVL